MTKKDYQLIASVIASNEANLSAEQREALAIHFSHCLYSTNKRFNPERFVTACKA